GGLLNNDFYVGQIRDTGSGLQPAIFKNIGGTFSTIAVGATVSSAGNATLEFEVVGSSLKLIYDGQLVAFGVDSSLTTGSVGMRLSNGAAVSSFLADVLTLPPLHFTDTFTTSSGGSHLDRNWTDRLGNVTVNTSTGQAIGTAATSLSTVNGVAQGDVRVLANVNVAVGSGQTVGLVARYGGPLNSNFYVGQI